MSKRRRDFIVEFMTHLFENVEASICPEAMKDL